MQMQHESNHVKEEKDDKEDRQSIKTTKDLLERMIGADGDLWSKEQGADEVDGHIVIAGGTIRGGLRLWEIAEEVEEGCWRAGTSSLNISMWCILLLKITVS